MIQNVNNQLEITTVYISDIKYCKFMRDINRWVKYLYGTFFKLKISIEYLRGRCSIRIGSLRRKIPWVKLGRKDISHVSN